MTERKYQPGQEVWIKAFVKDPDTSSVSIAFTNMGHDISGLPYPDDIRTADDFKDPQDQPIIDGILAAATDDGIDTIRLAFGNQVAEAIQAKLDATAHAPSAAEIINSHLYFDGMSDNGMLICKGCKEEHTDYAEHIAAKLAAAGRLVESDES